LTVRLISQSFIGLHLSIESFKLNGRLMSQ
jgi:hypothetical protein